VGSFTPRPLYSQGKNTRHPLDRRLGGSQSRSGRGGEVSKVPIPSCRESNPGYQGRSLVSVVTELIRLPTPYQVPFHEAALTKRYAITTYGWAEVQLHAFL